MRISNRMRSLSSSLNAKKLDQDYQRSLQIKKRLMRFVSNDNSKISLKYFDRNLRSDKYVDLKSTAGFVERQSESRSVGNNKNVSSHYNAEKISKNRAENGNNRLRNRNNFHNSISISEKNGLNATTDNACFFTT